MSCLGRLDGVVDNGSRVGTLLTADDLHTGPVCPAHQLLPCRRAEGVGRSQNHFFALVLELARQLADTCGLAHTVDADDQYHRRAVFKLIGGLAHVHLFLDALDQELLALSRIFDVLLLHFSFQVFDDGGRGIDPQISHDKDLLDLIIKIIIDAGKSAENRINSRHDVVSGLGQSLNQPFKKAFLFFHISLHLLTHPDRPR